MDRTAFEAWAKDRGQGIDRDGGGGDGYYWPSVHNAWVGWQAAWTASRALALEEAARVAIGLNGWGSQPAPNVAHQIANCIRELKGTP